MEMFLLLILMDEIFFVQPVWPFSIEYIYWSTYDVNSRSYKDSETNLLNWPVHPVLQTGITFNISVHLKFL